MLRATFRGAPGIGPSREKELWSRGITSWDELPDVGLVLSPKLDGGLRRLVEELKDLEARADARGLAARVPAGEHFRLWPLFEDRACFLDIETDGYSDVVTAVSLLDAEGPKAFVRGVNLEELPAALARHALLVTFNGSTFDVPVLKRAFGALPVPPIHVDLRHLWRRIGEPGGLKSLEERLGLPRPASVQGLGGWDAVQLWKHWTVNRDGRALRTLVEYNLYDAIQLRPLLDLAYNRMLAHYKLPLPPRAVWQRGDVLYDVSRLLDALPRGAEAASIERR